MIRIAVVSPVLDDWESFTELVSEISHLFTGADIAFRLVAVDDGSVNRLDLRSLELPRDTCIESIEVLRLALNLGHQRAIAVGLCDVAMRGEVDYVAVMDSDGEDRPDELPKLLAAARKAPLLVALAQRQKRSESFGFRTGYLAYKTLFRLMTGKTIDFGNFSILSIEAAKRLIYMPELWNNLAAAVMRSRLPIERVPTVRGKRYAGSSKMNVVSLAVHGLSAISVYTDIIFVRVLIAGAATAAATVLGAAIAVAMKLAPGLATPGWATTVVSSLLIILMQTLVLVVATSLMVLGGRSARPMVPALDCAGFVAERMIRLFERPEPVKGKVLS